jgi:hypothetical protein
MPPDNIPEHNSYATTNGTSDLRTCRYILRAKSDYRRDQSRKYQRKGQRECDKALVCLCADEEHFPDPRKLVFIVEFYMPDVGITVTNE